MTSIFKEQASLTIEGAQIALSAALAKAREIGAPECIAVVDASSRLLAYARMSGAAVLAETPAISKAATAASLGMATGGLPYEFGVNLAAASHNAFVNLPGGVPIIRDGKVIGAIGVGAGTSEQDVEVAEAGRDALVAALG